MDDDSIESVIDDLLPLRPGTSGGNALDTLDSQYLRGNEMEYLAELSNLMVINDEAHHIHENEDDAVKWQQGLDKIFANKKDDCYQVDFSATPFTSQGSGKKSRKNYFPHIVVDFDLVTAMRMGLVKTLLLDKRQELTDLSTLDYSAVRDGKRVIGLSEGQRLMLRAGLKKLKLLEEGFMRLDERKCPKMLVMCEDTQVSPHVANFLTEEGLDNEDILQIDSSKQGELKETEWARVKEKLFNIDRYSRPKVIVSVLMLREGFDVSNICVIVPLRSSTAPILLEQTIGRGLRLMRREPEYQEENQENRIKVLQKKLAPKSYIDMLTIIEHPVFEEFYKDLMEAGLAGEDTEDMTPVQPTGTLIKVGLKENYLDYDIAWPMVIRDAEEDITPAEIDPHQLAVFTLYPLSRLRELLVTKGETFASTAALTQTRFGTYKVTADLFTAQCYQDYLQKIIRIITTRIEGKGRELPTLQINLAAIAQILDEYIRTRLFGQAFDPFLNEDWKILLSVNGLVTAHVVKVMSVAIHNMQENVMSSDALVEQIWFSQVNSMSMREEYAIVLEKIIYERMNFPSNAGGLERRFMEFVDRDADVQRFIKVN